MKNLGKKIDTQYSTVRAHRQIDTCTVYSTRRNSPSLSDRCQNGSSFVRMEEEEDAIVRAAEEEGKEEEIDSKADRLRLLLRRLNHQVGL